MKNFESKRGLMMTLEDGRSDSDELDQLSWNSMSLLDNEKGAKDSHKCHDSRENKCQLIASRLIKNHTSDIGPESSSEMMDRGDETGNQS